MKKSPLNPLHERLGAHMDSSEGWTLPMSFSGLMDEHLAARSACAVFDISHTSKLRVRGNGALAWLETRLSSMVSECTDGGVQPTLLADTEGKIIDHMALLRESAGNFLLLGHAGMEQQAYEWLQAHLAGDGLELLNETDAWCGMALLGPQSEQVLTRVLRGVELPAAERFSRFTYQQQSLILGRMSLQQEAPSERCYEFFCPAVSGISWFESFIGAGAQPCGTATRECLRLERGCPGVGAEITRSSTPSEVRLDHLCSCEKGRPDTSAPRSVIARLRCAGNADDTPTPGSAVRDTAGNTIGRITSSTFSPAVDDVLAMAMITAPFVQPGMQLIVMVRGHAVPATVL